MTPEALWRSRCKKQAFTFYSVLLGAVGLRIALYVREPCWAPVWEPGAFENILCGSCKFSKLSETLYLLQLRAPVCEEAFE